MGCRQVEGDNTKKGAGRPHRRKIAETYFNRLASDVNVIWSKHCDTGVGPSKNLNKLVADDDYDDSQQPQAEKWAGLFVTCSIFFSFLKMERKNCVF